MIVRDPGKPENLASVPVHLLPWLAKHSPLFQKVTVLLIHDGSIEKETYETVNVSVSPGESSIDEFTVKTGLDSLKEYSKVNGMTIENSQGSLQRIGKNLAVVIEVQFVSEELMTTFRNRIVLFSGGGKKYQVTCSAGADQFDEYKETFDRILESFEIPPRQGHDDGRAKGPNFDFWPVFYFFLVVWVVSGVYFGSRRLLRYFRSRSAKE